MGAETKERALRDLTKAIVECKGLKKTRSVARAALRLEAKPLEIVDAVSKGLDEVGDLYERREYFLMELTLSGVTAAEIIQMIKPKLKVEGTSAKGRIVIGTVAGDVHHIGKDLVIAMLKARGFEVVDLGVDVPTETFLKTVREIKPDIVAMSALLTTAVDEMKKVVDGLKREGLRDSVKVMIGGRAVSSEFAEKMGADAYGATAVEAVRLVTRWMGEK